MIEKGIRREGAHDGILPFHIYALVCFPHIRGMGPMAPSHREAKRFPICTPSQGSSFFPNSRQCPGTLSFHLLSQIIPSFYFVFQREDHREHDFSKRAFGMFLPSLRGWCKKWFLLFPNTGIKLT